MRRILFVFFFLFVSLACAQQDALVIIEVITPNMGDSSQIFIVGNHKLLGRWDPSLVPLNQISNKKWRKEFLFPVGTILAYKITKGSWGTEAVDLNEEVPKNAVLKVEKDTLISIVITNWKDEFELPPKFVGQITGEVRYHKNLSFNSLLNRDIIVWLPPDYENSTDSYPVLYMQDGQNLFDPLTSTFGIDWQLDETANRLIDDKEINPLIIVGINNTPNRTHEYTPGDTGEIYMDFIVNELKPMIDTAYRTKPGRKFTAVGGSSAGGIISFMLVWKHSNVFSKAICMSPAFKIEDIDYVKRVKQYEGIKKDIFIYIYNGGVDLEERLQPGVNEMLNALDYKGFELNKDLFYVKDENAWHGEPAWGKWISKPLKLFFKNENY